MGPIKTACLGLAAAALLLALLATGAQAGEYGSCVKQAKVNRHFKGHYLDKGCTSKATVQETEVGGSGNEWNWEGGTPTPAVTTKGKVVALQITGEGGTITCKKHTSTGQVTSSKEASMQITFTECSRGMTAETCETAGQAPGTIVWPVFDRLVDHGEHGHGGGEPVEGELWSELTVFPNAEFTCGTEGASFLVFDSFAGVTTGKTINQMGKKDTTAFGAGKAEQTLEVFYENPATSKQERLHATVTAEDTVLFAERIEIRL